MQTIERLLKNDGGVVLRQAEHGKAALEYLLGSEKSGGKTVDGVPTAPHYVDCLVCILVS